MEGPAASEVAIFWDYENCHPPSDVSAHKLVEKIRCLAQTLGPIKIFKAYVDLSLECTNPRFLALHSDLQSSGVTLVHCPHNGKKDVADKMMIVDILTFAFNNHGAATIAIITEDRDFAYAAATLRLRGHKVAIFTRNKDAILKMQADVIFDWQKIVLGAISKEEDILTDSDNQMNSPNACVFADETKSNGYLSLTDRYEPGLTSPSACLKAGPGKIHDCAAQDSTETVSSVSSSSQSTDGSTSHSMFPSPIGRFRTLIEYFHDQWALTGETRIRSSIVASELLKRDPKVYEKAAVRQMKQYIEEARLAKLIITPGMDSQGDCWIEIAANLPEFVALREKDTTSDAISPPKPKKKKKAPLSSSETVTSIVDPMFKPLVDRLRMEHPSYQLSDSTLGPFFRAEHPHVYKLAKVATLSRYLLKAKERGVVYFPGPHSLGRQCVRLVQALRRK
ncbi:hypothetical protein ACEPAF_4850 [Sanghuangporus sanghuang]